ncbi:MAG: hypothetical protein AVDCRST_MAG39-329, partial [uncultured Sphingomonadaceae bacterium]
DPTHPQALARRRAHLLARREHRAGVLRRLRRHRGLVGRRHRGGDPLPVGRAVRRLRRVHPGRMPDCLQPGGRRRPETSPPLRQPRAVRGAVRRGPVREPRERRLLLAAPHRLPDRQRAERRRLQPPLRPLLPRPPLRWLFRRRHLDAAELRRPLRAAVALAYPARHHAPRADAQFGGVARRLRRAHRVRELVLQRARLGRL